MTNFLCGAARVCITPAVGGGLYGYEPDIFSTSVHDDLTLTAVAFAENGEICLMISATVGDMQTKLCDELCNIISSKTAVPARNILISATHTHSAPNVAGTEGWGDLDHDYLENIFLPKIVEVASSAVSALAPAEIAVGTTDSFVGVNRRQLMPDNTVEFGQNPHGCFDPTMTVIAVRRPTGEGVVNLIHYGCHGTAAGANHEITRDWSGVMIDRMEAETGVLTAFFNGAMGDAGPRLTNGRTTGNIRFVEELGGVAAQDAMRARRALSDYHEAHLRLHVGSFEVPFSPFPSLKTVEDELKKYPNPEILTNIDRMTYAHFKAVFDCYQRGETERKPSLSIPQTIVDLGEVVFLPFRYEMFAEVTLRLKEYIGRRNVLTISNTNGYEAYLPAESELCRGGYEVECFRAGNIDRLVDNADWYFIKGTIANLG